MKKIIALVLVSCMCLGLFALDFTDVDALFWKTSDPQKVYDELKVMLSQASNNSEKAEVLWRLSRVCVDLGDRLPEKDKDGKFAIYEEGEQYGIDSIALKPTAEGYLWKCSNVGRWGQTKGVLNSLKKAGPMEDDLKTMVNDLKCLDSSEAWYVLAVLYDSIPGKSSDAAISYGRLAVETIPDFLIYGGTYQQLAEMLYNRNWNAKKRVTEFAKMKKNWDKETVNSEKYKYYEGTEADKKMPWTTKALSELSDREEAIQILQYAQKIYETRTDLRLAGDEDNYKEIADLLKKWTK